VGCKGGAESAIEIRAERSSPTNESGSNSRGKRLQLGVVCQALSQHSLFLAGAARNILVDYREGQAIRPHG